MFRRNVLKLNHHLCLCILLLSSTILACSEQELGKLGSDNLDPNNDMAEVSYENNYDQEVSTEPATDLDTIMEAEPPTNESCEAVIYMGYTLCLTTDMDNEVVSDSDAYRSESCLTPEQMVEILENTLREQHPESVDEDGNLIVKVSCTDADQDCFHECEGWDLGMRQDPDDRRASIPRNPNLDSQLDDPDCLTVNDGEISVCLVEFNMEDNDEQEEKPVTH